MEELICIVCGMRVNSRNSLMNRYSFLESNTEEHIINCPFCGVSSRYLFNVAEALKTDIEGLDAESLKVLDCAMKLEVFNGEFYQEASKMAQSVEAARMFEDLSRIELMHARVHMKFGGFPSLPRLHKPDYSKHNSDELLLLEASKRERHAVHFYSRNSSKVNSHVLRRAFAALAEVEKQHIEITGNR